MRLLLKVIAIASLLLAALTNTGCAPQVVAPATAMAATMTPFQPLPPTPTSTITRIPSPTPTTTPSPSPLAAKIATAQLPTEMPAPMAVEPDQVETLEIPAGSVTVPILLYHHVSDTIQSQYSVTTTALEEQMRWLYDNNYRSITISELARLVREGGSIPARPIVITFDDGYLDLYQNAYPILRQFGFTATAFIIANTVDTRGNLSSEQLRELIRQGWEIGSHSMHHTDLTLGIGWQEEIITSKTYLEDKLGVEILTFAYPYGLADSAVMDYTYNAGYTSAAGLGSSVTHERSTLYYLSRKEIKSWYTLDFFEKFLPWSN